MLIVHTNLLIMVNPNFTSKVIPQRMTGEERGENREHGGDGTNRKHPITLTLIIVNFITPLFILINDEVPSPSH